MTPFSTASLSDGLAGGVGDEVQGLVLDLVEPGPVLVLGVHEELDLHLVELPHPDHALAGGDLVPVAPAGLDDSEGHLLPVVPVEVREVDEDPLGGLGPEVADTGGPGSDVGLEHEVELLDRSEVPAAVGALDVVLHERLLELLGGEHVGVLVEVLDQVVGPEGRLALGAVGEEVGELVDVA